MSDPTQSGDAEQERARVMLRSLDVSAPPRLHAAVQEQIDAAARRRGRRTRPRFMIPSLAAAAVAAVVIALVLSGGTSSNPTLRQAAAVALSHPIQPSPRNNGTTLDVSAAGIPFPYWKHTVGWTAIGSRQDVVAGRRIVTVFYAAPGQPQVGYAIVSGRPLNVSGGQSQDRHGVTYVLLRQGSATVITWRRGGHTCVIAGRHATDRTLLRLASTAVPQ